jgi:hypothetical protein
MQGPEESLLLRSAERSYMKDLNLSAMIVLAMALTLFLGIPPCVNALDGVSIQAPGLSGETFEAAESEMWSFAISADDTYWSSILIRNLGDELASVSLEAFYSDGNLPEIIETLDIAPGKTHVVSTANIRGTIPKNTAEITIIATRSVGVSGIMGLMNDNWTTVLRGVARKASCQIEDSNRDTAEGVFEPKLIGGCCGYSSPGNICKYCPSCGDKGNCTWWAWKNAQDNWSQSLPWCTKAKAWARMARLYTWPVKKTPAPNTICVNSTYGLYGHVAWVESVDGSYINVSEMIYCYSCKQNNRYPISFCDKGFIYKK